MFSDQPYHALLKEIRRQKQSSAINDSCDAALLELFVRDVFPAISLDYRKTVASLSSDKQHHDLIHQLRESLIGTTKLVLQNNREEQCLHASTVSGLTHVYPLLLRKISKLSKSIFKRMKSEELNPSCWYHNTQKECTKKSSFSLALPLGLWTSFSRLLKEYGAVCKIYQAEKSTAHSRICPEAPYSWSYSPKYCKIFSSVNISAFFMHANQTLGFVKPGNTLLRKAVWANASYTIGSGSLRKSDKTKAYYTNVTGFLNLLVSKNYPFTASYNSSLETVKITFHYVPVKICTVRSLCNSCEECQNSLHGILEIWLKSIRNHRKRIETCPVQRSKCKPMKIKVCKPSLHVWKQMKDRVLNSSAVVGRSRKNREYIEFKYPNSFEKFFLFDFCPENEVHRLTTQPWYHAATKAKIRLVVASHMRLLAIRNHSKTYAKVKAYFITE